MTTIFPKPYPWPLSSCKSKQSLTQVNWVNEQCLKALNWMFYFSVVSVTLPSPSPRLSSTLLQFYKSSTEYMGVSFTSQMMETSVPDMAAIPCRNLTALCFLINLLKQRKRKNIIPYADLCATHPHFFQIPQEKQHFPTGIRLSLLMLMKFIIGDVETANWERSYHEHKQKYIFQQQVSGTFIVHCWYVAPK